MRSKIALSLLLVLLSSYSFAGQLPEYLYNVQNTAIDIVKDDYKEALITAINDPEYLGSFTNHTKSHIVMVSEKTLEISKTFETAIKSGTFQKADTFERNEKDSTRINFGIGTGEKEIVVASICHDSGMKTGGFVLDKEGKVVFDENGKYKRATDGNDVRKNHALNSAINVLIKRNELDKIGADIDVVCLLAFAHSKSTSGIKDMNSRADWQKGFDRLDSVIKVYNSEHDNKIYLNRDKFEKNDDAFRALITAALALRLGDVSRDSGKHAKSQNGGEIVVYRSTVNSFAKDAPGEALNARVYNYRTGYVDSLFSRQVHVGEQNNVFNHTVIDSDGKVCHEMTMEDGNYAPYCTFQNVIEHAGELESAPDADTRIKILFNNKVEGKFQNVYNHMREDYYNKKGNKAIPIAYPWDFER